MDVDSSHHVRPVNWFLLKPVPVAWSVIVDPAIDGGPLSAIFSLLAIIVVTILLFLFAACVLLVDFGAAFVTEPRCHSFIGGLEFADRILIDGCLFVEFNSV